MLSSDPGGRIVVIGSSISGGIAACYLKIRFPQLEVVSIQKPGAKFPIVGESLTEFSTLMLHEIGLAGHLETDHFHKFGLTFYFKERIEDPTDYTYATHEAMRIPPMPSNQVNRLTLAVRLRERAAELGVKQIDGIVRDVSVNQSGPHRLTYAHGNGDEADPIDARWVVDASGRNRVLATRLGLRKAPKWQRSSFWFRLTGFDRKILNQMREVKAAHHNFDSYYVTHHFLGHGNWIWAIPMRSDDGEDLISIGIIYRPDVYDGEVRTVDDFLRKVGAEHPVITRLVESGRIVDTNVFRNYFYETERSYSRANWFIVGDAGDTVDPLYSTGIATTSVQVKQVAALIGADLDGTSSEEYVRDIEGLYKTIRDALQGGISRLYEVMDDPYQSHIGVHCASAFYFYLLLPAYLCGYITDRTAAPLLAAAIRRGVARYESLRPLLEVASRRLGPLPATSIPNLYDRSVNWQLSGPCEARLGADLARASLFFARVRFDVLRKAGWHRWTLHLPLCLEDLARAFVFGVIVGRRAGTMLRFAKWLGGRRGGNGEPARGSVPSGELGLARDFRPRAGTATAEKMVPGRAPTPSI